MKSVSQKIAAVSALTVGAVASANAALPSTVTDTITSSTADMEAAGWLVVGVVVVIFGIKLVKRMF
ncbi:major capsid protein [Methylomonas sp. CM2]|uniref:major capsid protein n=1 Tax=Methylomonas sp. CM2 TaxID=3417647 RepID=UPI003CF734D8